MKDQNDVPKEAQDESSRPSGMARRNFLRAPAAVAATIALPSMFGSVFMADAAKAATGRPILDPEYYPLKDFEPELELHGKVAVITGASRGIGRATAEALIALGAEVIGTSRNVARLRDRPAYHMLDLDITEPQSVHRFVGALTRKLHGRKVDILINNAGRFVLGNIICPPTGSPKLYLEQLQLGTETLYLGHIRLTQAILPLMPTEGYARLLFTASIAAYLVGGTDPITPWVQGYLSAKRALLAYANSLRHALNEASSSIRLSTVSPYFVATQGAEHPNPIYTEPVLDNGFTDEPPTATPFNQFLGFIRQRQAAGLPPAFVGDAYAQLLTLQEPPANVVVASTEEPLATQGGSEFIGSISLAENAESGLTLNCS